MSLGIKYREYRGGPKDGEICLCSGLSCPLVFVTTYDATGRALHVHVYRLNRGGHFFHAKIILPGDEDGER